MAALPDAEPWARTVLAALGTEFPYAAAHVSRGPDDVDVSPRRLHPVFHGSFDWHSSAHMQWSAVRLLTLAPSSLSTTTREALVAMLDERLTRDACPVEAAYLRAHPHFERPYGWAWTAMLAAAAADCPVPQAATWAQATRPLYDEVGALLTAWLPSLAYPIRQGEHANTAFGLSLVHEAARAFGDDALAALVGESARSWFDGERDYPARWEPGGSDFLSPALCEADLMRRVCGEDFAGWLAAFLPGLGTEGDPLLGVPEVRDSTDGKGAHLLGLALSRAWQLRLLAPSLPEDRAARVRDAADRQVATVGPEIVAGHFMATHWLVSFALLAETARPQR